MAEYIKFKPGYSYVYTLNSTIEMKHVETFLARAKVGFRHTMCVVMRHLCACGWV